MASLANRANPRQAMVMRIVQGAAINAADAHKDWNFDRRLASSIAKRAAGTLTACWPNVLAAPSVSSESVSTQFASAVGPSDGDLCGRHRRGAPQVPRRAPLRLAYNAIGALAGDARRNGQTERLDALADALRIIAKLLEP